MKTIHKKAPELPGNFADAAPTEANQSKTVQGSTLKTKVKEKQVNINKLQLHEQLRESKLNISYEKLIPTIKVFGILDPIKVIKSKQPDEYIVIDGERRLRAAQELGDETVPVQVIEPIEANAIIDSILFNTTVQRTAREKVFAIRNMLGRLGSSQGKKRDNLSVFGADLDDCIGDRFALVGKILDMDESPSTLRKYLEVDDFDKCDETFPFSLIDMIDEGKMSISKAVQVAKRVKAEKEQKDEFITELYEPKIEKDYQIYNVDNKTAFQFLPRHYANMQYCSVDYFRARNYRNVDTKDQIGRTQDVEKYVDDLVALADPFLKKILTEDGVFIYNVSEIYRKNQSLGIPELLVVKMKAAGWKYIQEVSWVKTNPTPISKFNGFRPSTEKFLIFAKSENHFWRELRSINSDDDYRLSFNNGKVQFESPSKRLTDFIDNHQANDFFQTPVFNKKEHLEIDPNYSHQAPQNEIVPLMFILHFTEPGMSVCDLFAGSGTTGAVALKYGRKSVNFDLDPTNVEFMEKRFKKIIESGESTSNREIEKRYFDDNNLKDAA